MKKIILVILILALFPISTSFSQNSDTKQTLGIQLTSFTPYHYKSQDGKTVIIGEVINTQNFPVSGVKIWADFYGSVTPSSLESIIGTTLLDVIPANGRSPYVIISPSPNSAITLVSVKLLGFNSVGAKTESLSLDSGSLYTFDKISYTGTITNNAETVAKNVTIHLVMYDTFEPPRLLKASTIHLDQPIKPGDSAEFSFDEERLSNAVGFKILAESKNFFSNILDMKIKPNEFPTKKITINDVLITNNDGNRLSTVPTNSTILIQSNIWIQIATPDEVYDQDYIYYTQIKQSGKNAFVEYIGTFEGHFDKASSQIPTTSWTPKTPGLYFIETFVWDTNGIPLASQGPIILVLVN